MRQMVDAEELVSYLRDEVRAGKAAAVVAKYAKKHAVEAAAVGDKVPIAGYQILISRDNTIQIIPRDSK